MPRKVTMPDGATATLPDGMPDSAIPEFVGQYMKGRGMPLLSRKPSDSTMGPETSQEKLSRYGDTAIEVAANAAPIAAGFIPGAGPAARIGLQAGVGAATYLLRDFSRNQLGIEKTSLGKAAADATTGALLFGGLEGAGQGVGLIGRKLSSGMMGEAPTAEARGLFNSEAGRVTQMSAAEARGGAGLTLQRYWESSIFGKSGYESKRIQILSNVTDYVDKWLGSIKTEVGGVDLRTQPREAAAKIADNMFVARKAAQDRLVSPAYSEVYSAANAAAGKGGAKVEVERDALAKYSTLADTVDEVAKDDLAVEGQAKRIKDIINRFRPREDPDVVAKRAPLLEQKKAAESVLKKYPNDPTYTARLNSVNADLKELEPKNVGPMSIEAAGEFRSELSEIAYEAGYKSKKLAKVAREARDLVDEQMNTTLDKLDESGWLSEGLSNARKLAGDVNEAFDTNAYQKMARDNPELLVQSMLSPQHYGELKKVKDALVTYGGDNESWVGIKRLWLQEHLASSGVKEANPTTDKLATGLVAGVKDTATMLRTNGELRTLLSDDPGTKKAIDRFVQLADVLERKGPLGVKEASHFGVFFAQHILVGGLMAAIGGGAGYKESGPLGAIGGATGGMLLAYSAPGILTKFMYSKVAGDIFINGIRGMMASAARGIAVNPQATNQVIRAGVMLAQDTSLVLNPPKTYTIPSLEQK